MSIFLLFLLAFFAFLGTPLFTIIGASAIINYHNAEMNLQGIMINLYQLSSKPLLQALPLFAFSGYLLTYSQAPTRLLRFSKALLGWLPGGLAVVTIIACSLLTALTGASGITIIALGGILLPALIKDQYSRQFSLGLITSGGSMGLLFAPSLPIILYGVTAKSNIDELFRSGLLPGILCLTILSGYGIFYAVKNKIPRQNFSSSELLQSIWESKWELPLPLLVIGGIYTGKFAISEAAVAATAYLIFVEVIVHREIRIQEVGSIARESMILVGGILIIMGMTFAITNYLIDEDIPVLLLEYFKDKMHSKYSFLIALNIFLLIVGCMIDIYAAIVLLVPLISPAALEYGIHPAHLGIVFLANLGIGYITPPVGLNLFIASIRFNEPIVKLYWASLGFFFCLLAALIIITYLPILSTFLIQ